ncbi:MAG: hypothetical protein K8U03_01585 [Planctomycetia bacterium]|nr:hypothetical protein [Planctomycetia bacterium]
MHRRFLMSSIVLALAFGAGAQSAEPPPATVAETSAPEQAPPTKSAPKLDAQVVALLRQTALALESRSVEPAEEPAFRTLLTAGDLLRDDRTLAPSERERLRALVRVRLVQAADVLKRQAVKELAAKKVVDLKKTDGVRAQPKTVQPPAATTLAQQFPIGAFGQAGGNGGANGPRSALQASAEELMDIITSNIKPESWDINGGTAVIRYFAVGDALVIRATADTHGGVGDLIGQLRK